MNAILIGSDDALLPHVRRELANISARLEAELPDAGAVIDTLRRTPAEKRILILHMASIHDLEPLRRLAVHFPGWPVVALVAGYDPKASLGEVIVNLLRAGASQILPLPIQAADFKAAFDRIASLFVFSSRETKAIAVAGVTGGSGATTVALNLAFEIAHRHGLRCILADLSLRMGMVAAHLDIEPEHTIIDLLRDTGRIDSVLAQQALVKVADNFEILAGPHELVAPVVTSPEDVACVVDALMQIADVVVLDVPCTYDDIYFETLAAAGQAVLIGEQKLPSIRALKMVREAIGRGVGTEHVVVNKFDPKNKAFAIQRILKPLGVTALRTVARDDPGMGAAVEGACTLRLAAPRSPALADIVALADSLLAVDTPPRKKLPGLFSRLGRAFANS